MRGCIMMHGKPLKSNTGVLTLLEKFAPHFEEKGFHLDIMCIETNMTSDAKWISDRTMIKVKKKYRPFSALMFGMQMQGIAMHFENFSLYEALFERLKKVHYDFVFCLSSTGFQLLSMYGINKHLPLWCDLNLLAWEKGYEHQYRYLYGIDNVWVSSHFKIEDMLREKWDVKNFFPTTYPIDLAEQPPPFAETEDYALLIGNKRAGHKTPNWEQLDKSLNGKLVWLTGMPNPPELEYGTSHGFLERSKYNSIIRKARFGVHIAKHECLGIAILEQAALHPIFLQDRGDFKARYLKIHEVCPTFKTMDELHGLMRHYSHPKRWQEQVDKQRKYIAENFNQEKLSECIQVFVDGIKPAPIPKDGSIKGTMSVEEILAKKGWNDGVSALSMFRKLKSMGYRTVETANATYFTTDKDFEPKEEEKIDAWDVF